jgi:hypothetical protein
MMLREAYQNMTGPFTIDDASDLTDVVPCDLVDDQEAQSAPTERTLQQVRVNLSKPEIQFRWFVADIGPEPGTNP